MHGSVPLPAVSNEQQMPNDGRSVHASMKASEPREGMVSIGDRLLGSDGRCPFGAGNASTEGSELQRASENNALVVQQPREPLGGHAVGQLREEASLGKVPSFAGWHLCCPEGGAALVEAHGAAEERLPPLREQGETGSNTPTGDITPRSHRISGGSAWSSGSSESGRTGLRARMLAAQLQGIASGDPEDHCDPGRTAPVPQGPSPWGNEPAALPAQQPLPDAYFGPRDGFVPQAQNPGKQEALAPVQHPAGLLPSPAGFQAAGGSSDRPGYLLGAGAVPTVPLPPQPFAYPSGFPPGASAWDASSPAHAWQEMSVLGGHPQQHLPPWQQAALMAAWRWQNGQLPLGSATAMPPPQWPPQLTRDFGGAPHQPHWNQQAQQPGSANGRAWPPGWGAGFPRQGSPLGGWPLAPAGTSPPTPTSEAERDPPGSLERLSPASGGQGDRGRTAGRASPRSRRRRLAWPLFAGDGATGRRNSAAGHMGLEQHPNSIGSEPSGSAPEPPAVALQEAAAPQRRSIDLGAAQRQGLDLPPAPAMQGGDCLPSWHEIEELAAPPRARASQELGQTWLPPQWSLGASPHFPYPMWPPSRCASAMEANPGQGPVTREEFFGSEGPPLPPVGEAGEGQQGGAGEQQFWAAEPVIERVAPAAPRENPTATTAMPLPMDPAAWASMWNTLLAAQQQQQQQQQQQAAAAPVQASSGGSMGLGQEPVDKDSLEKQELRRARRMLSNRESARRSRKRKQEHLSNLETEKLKLAQLKEETEKKLQAQSDEMERLRDNADRLEEENHSLREEVAALKAEIAVLREGASGTKRKDEGRFQRSGSLKHVPSAERLNKRVKPDLQSAGSPGCSPNGHAGSGQDLKAAMKETVAV